MAAPTGPNVGMEVAASQPRGSSQIPRRRARAHTDLIHVLEMSLSLHTFDAQDARWRKVQARWLPTHRHRDPLRRQVVRGAHRAIGLQRDLVPHHRHPRPRAVRQFTMIDIGYGSGIRPI